MTELITRAKRFAILAHDCQLRKYSKEQYWHHLHDVARMVREAGGTPEMIAAAWLHDTVEDTHVEHEDICHNFGVTVSRFVYYLTDISVKGDGNRAYRKMLDRNHVSSGPAEVHTIKVCDLISNTKSIVEHDQHFAKVYLKEKVALLEVLTDADPVVMNTAKRQVSTCCEKAGIVIG